jgi:septal ring factor EnvC (AmiA/AmiB activator)
MPLRSTCTLMIDAFPSESGKDSEAVTRHLHGRLIVGAVAALMIVAAAFVWRIASGPPSAPQVAAPAPTATSPALNELVEATKALEVSQQQAIDQLQVLQQQLASQQADAKKSSDEVEALSDKLETLRQSFASISAQPEEADAPQPRESRPAAHTRRAHRGVSARARIAATRH